LFFVALNNTFRTAKAATRNENFFLFAYALLPTKDGENHMKNEKSLNLCKINKKAATHYA